VGNLSSRTRKRKLPPPKIVAAQMEAIGESKELAGDRVPVALQGAANGLGCTRENVAAESRRVIVRGGEMGGLVD
jgi:hypothetical protein